MAYFKWDKETGEVIAQELQTAVKDLQSIMDSIDLFIQETDGKPDNLKGWEDEYDKGLGKWIRKLLWDWTGDYEDFKRWHGKVCGYRDTMKSDGKKKLEGLSSAMTEMQQLIDMFDDDYIPGTKVRKPRAQRLGETEDEYLEYLENYYATYLPGENGKGTRK